MNAAGEAVNVNPAQTRRLRAAGAPISWGVSEVTGWGHQMSPRRVLAEMRGLGLLATELGPAGFLPAEPARRAAVLDSYGIRVVGGFVPVVLHDPAVDPSPALARVAAGFAESGAGVLVLAADLGQGGSYEERKELDPQAWRTLLGNLDRAVMAAAEHGVVAALHPHVGTAVERPGDVQRVLDGSSVPLCVDTGHYLVGGGNPAELAAAAADRIAHVHLKDADPTLAERVRSGDLGYAEAVSAGLFRPLGRGGAAIAEVVGTLEAAGYRGWYVLEQDTRLLREPPAGGGPIGAVRASLDYLASIGTKRTPGDG